MLDPFQFNSINNLHVNCAARKSQPVVPNGNHLKEYVWKKVALFMLLLLVTYLYDTSTLY